jgi:GLPGLI family protein
MIKIFLILFFCTNFLIAQPAVKGLVEYKVSYNKGNVVDNKKDQEISAQLLAIINNAEDINAYLWFTEHESLYLLDEKMGNDVKSGINITKIFAGSSNIYYTNIKNDEMFKQTSTLGKYFRVTFTSPKWKITKEKKEILGYLCYKAISLEGDNQVIAWFTPELSFSYGPLYYNGLPGLILKLTNSKLVFEAETMDLNPPNFQLNVPTKGEKISSEKYKEIAKKSMPTFFEKN